MPIRLLEKKLSQLELKNQLIHQNLKNAQYLPTTCLPPVSQKLILQTF